MNRILAILILFSYLGFAQTRMSAEAAKSLQQLVKQKAEETQTITSDFVQYKHLDFLSSDIESTGKMAYKSPDNVSWQYVKPFSYKVVFKGQKLLINDNGNKSKLDLGSNELFKQLNHLISASINGNMFNANDFEIAYFKENETSLVHFLPRDPQFSEFILAFHITFSQRGTVEEVKMIEPSGDYTRIVFSNRIENKTLPDAVFDL
ncbi:MULTISPECIES: LolA family protein [Maribacter]|uniref:Outer membrane lipoprotein carrier protein LolA n=1 Tax=Maribacter flavus TaxID=1658664 RepID=A0ABU7IEG5_9FLAO|nr:MULTISPECIES: outer membrane lipoprotein carrier protein LolA [Maribacter]MDC6403885.1 outer membrane lipoprotein carrier protein LolA [Maribacter sp. PR66]MEE1971026.1 outer membrane lipoprotein carrier protein LolA [Maribacter flavus]